MSINFSHLLDKSGIVLQELSDKAETTKKLQSEKLDQSEAELNQKNTEIAELQSQLQKAKENTSKHENEIKMKDEQLSELDSRLQNTQAEMQGATEQLSQLKVQLEKLAGQERLLREYKETIDVSNPKFLLSRKCFFL